MIGHGPSPRVHERISDRDREKMLSLYRDHDLSITLIAERFRLSRPFVGRVLHEAGIPVARGRRRYTFADGAG